MHESTKYLEEYGQSADSEEAFSSAIMKLTSRCEQAILYKTQVAEIDDQSQPAVSRTTDCDCKLPCPAGYVEAEIIATVPGGAHKRRTCYAILAVSQSPAGTLERGGRLIHPNSCSGMYKLFSRLNKLSCRVNKYVWSIDN